MNADQIAGLVRHAMTSFGGILVAKGVVDETMVLEFAGAAAVLVGIVWSFWAKRATT